MCPVAAIFKLMHKQERLTSRAQFEAVYQGGGSWSSELVVLKALYNGLGYSRCGFSLSRGVGKAVVRNRIKRLLREIMYSMRIEPGWDVVLIARRAAVEANYHQLKAVVERLLIRAHLLRYNL